MDWSGVDYLWIIVMFLSAVWTLILTAPIHCRGSIGEQVMECYISPNLMKKQTHLHLGWPDGECIFSKLIKHPSLVENALWDVQHAPAGEASLWRRWPVSVWGHAPGGRCATESSIQPHASGQQYDLQHQRRCESKHRRRCTRTVWKRQQRLLPWSGPETQLQAGRPQVKQHPQEARCTGEEVRSISFLCAPSCSVCHQEGVLIPTESDSVIGWWLGDVTTQGAMGSGRENVTGIWRNVNMKCITFLCLLVLSFFCDFSPEAISSHTTKSNLGLNVFEPLRYDCVGKSLVFAFLEITHLFTMHIKIHQFCSQWSGDVRTLGSVYSARWNTMLVVCHKGVYLCVVIRSGRRAENWLARMQLVISSCCSPALEICTCTIMHRDISH